MEKKKRYITVTLLFALYIAGVLFLCLFNFSKTDIRPPQDFLGIPFDKVVHFLIFFFYPIMCWLMLHYNEALGVKRKYILSCIILSGMAFAFLSEIAQKYLTTYRSGDPMDMLADFTGVVVGSLLLLLLRKPVIRLFNRILA